MLAFFFLMALWIILSGKFDLFHLVLGVISSAVVAKWSGDLLFPEKRPLKFRLKEFFKFCGYTVWLLGQIVLSNLHVFSLAISPNLDKRLTPQTFRFKAKMPNDLAHFILGNSITLTPGTVTIQIKDDEYLVHSVSRKTAEATPGQMPERIAAIFEETKQ